MPLLLPFNLAFAVPQSTVLSHSLYLQCILCLSIQIIPTLLVRFSKPSSPLGNLSTSSQACFQIAYKKSKELLHEPVFPGLHHVETRWLTDLPIFLLRSGRAEPDIVKGYNCVLGNRQSVRPTPSLGSFSRHLSNDSCCFWWSRWETEERVISTQCVLLIPASNCFIFYAPFPFFAS